MKDIKEHITCENCSGTTETKLITKTFRRNGQSFTYQNIKAEVCRNCGERYLDGKTMLRIEKDIKQNFVVAV